MIPSKIENWTVICDFKGCGMTAMNKKTIKTATRQMSQNFKGRLFRMYSINTHWFIRTLFSIAKSKLNEFTLFKVHILGSDYTNDLLKVIPADNLEERFGGKLPNKEKNFFPPELK
jgi:hypothetical protein